MGDVLNSLDRFILNSYSKFVPLHLRTFGATLVGNRNEITEKDLSDDEQRRLIRDTAQRAKVLGNTANRVKDGRQALQIDSYGSQSSPDIKQTLGSYGLRFNKDGSGTVYDTYDFHPQKRRVVSQEGPPQPVYDNGAPGVDVPNKGIKERFNAITNLLSSAFNGTDDPGDQDANVAINGASRKVNIRLTPEQMKQYQMLRKVK